MKWLVGIGIALVAVALGVAFLAYASAIRAPRPVGFQVVQAHAPGRDPLAIAIWYPTTGRPLPTTPLGLTLLDVVRDGPVTGDALPLVLISHGNGGGPGGHADTAMSLAAAGFVVAAPLHNGDNYLDESAFGARQWLPDRTREIQVAIDYVLWEWSDRARIAHDRIGIFGFSAGALTALIAVGAEPDIGRVATHCANTPEFVCTLLSAAHSELLADSDLSSPVTYVYDPRIRAAVVAAPGLGFALTPESLARITAPVQLWSGDADTNVPYASNTALVREALGAHAEAHSVRGAGHFAFLAPCGPIGPPLLCRDGPGFDRASFHRTFNSEVAKFFRERLNADRQDRVPVRSE